MSGPEQSAATVDLRPVATALGRLVAGVGDDQLAGPTPCPRYTVGDLLHHVGGLAVAFTGAAAKDASVGSQAPSGDGSQLPPGWRDDIATRLTTLADAWRDPAAWDGMTRAGGIDLPGEVAGLVALDEMVVHGWDVARATGQDWAPEQDAVRACIAFLTPGPDDPDEDPSGMFGPRVPVAADAVPMDRLVGLAGRNPQWAPL